MADLMTAARERGLIGVSGEITPYGEFVRAHGDHPNFEPLSKLYKKDLIDIELNPTERGRMFAMTDREAAEEGLEFYRQWEESGAREAFLEDTKDPRGLLTKSTEVGAEILGMIPKAYQGARALAKNVMSNLIAPDSQYAQEADAAADQIAGEYTREAMRTPFLLAQGGNLVLNKAAQALGANVIAAEVNQENGHAGPADVTRARWQFLDGQNQIDDLTTAELTSIVPFISLEEMNEIRRRAELTEGYLTEEEAETAREQGRALGELAGPVDLATEGLTAGVGAAGLKLGTLSSKKLYQLQREVLEAGARRSLLEQKRTALEGIIQTGKGSSKAAARRQLPQVMAEIDTAKFYEAERLGALQRIEERVGRSFGREMAGGAAQRAGRAAEWAGGKVEKVDRYIDPLRPVAGYAAGGFGGIPLSMLSKGSVVRKAGEYAQILGSEFARRRGTLPYWRRVAQNPAVGRWGSGAALTLDALARPVNATGRLGKAAGRGVLAELPFSYIAAGGEGDWLADAIGEGVVFGGLGGTLGIVSQAAGIPAFGNKDDFTRQAIADASELRKTLPASQQAQFDVLPSQAKRAVGVYSAVFPDVTFRFDDKIDASFWDPHAGIITIKTNSKNSLGPLLAHEVSHYLHDQGFAETVVESLVGEDGFLRKDGELIPEFVEFKERYINMRRGADPDFTIDDRGAALEWFAEANVQGLTDGVESGKLQRLARRHPLTRRLGDGLLNMSQLGRNFLQRSGVLMDERGNATTGPGALGGIHQQSPAVARMLDAYLRQNAGKASRTATTREKAPKVSVTEPTSDMGSQFEVDEKGKIRRDKWGVPVPLAKETINARETGGRTIQNYAEQNEVEGATDSKGTVFNLSPEDWDKILAEFKASGVYNDLQLEALRQATNEIREGNGQPLLMVYQKVYKTLRKKGRNLQSVPKRGFEPQYRVFIPYDIAVTDAGNILIRSIDPQQLEANIVRAAKTPAGKKLYNGDTSAIWVDVLEMADNHRHNIPNEPIFGAEKLNFLNAVFGDVGRGHKDANPMVGTLKKAGVHPTVRSVRLDRVNKFIPAQDVQRVPYRQAQMVQRAAPEPVEETSQLESEE